jgi:integrase
MSVYKHRGKWMYDFWKNAVRYRDGGYETKTEAQDEEAKVRANAKRINTDFMKLCTSRLEELELRRTKGHFERNKLLIKNLIKKWATLKTVTSEHVTEYLNEVAKVSKHKANVELRLIKALFYHGVKKKWFEVNPVTGMEPFGVEKKRKYIPPIEDIKKVLDLADEEQKKYLLTVMHTLGRMREINNLKPSDVYEDYLVLRTRKAKNSNVVERNVPYTDTLRAVIQSLPKDKEYLFTNPRTGTRYDYRRKLLKGLCKKAQVKPFGLHALRHYGASKLAKEGVPLTDIQEILGHTRPTTTDHYLQSIIGSVKTSIKKLED